METHMLPLITWRSQVASEVGPASPVTRHVLLTLALHMNEKGGSCFPSTKTLATETGLSERAVCTHLANAEKEGWIRRQLVGYKGKKWARMEYSAAIPWAKIRSKDGSDMFAEGTERHSVPESKALNVTREGTERHDIKALNDVQSSSSVNSSVNSSAPAASNLSSETKPKNQTLDLLPTYIDRELWDGFMEVRAKRKAVNSERAIKSILKELDLYHRAGYDCNQIIEKSIRGSWKDVYPPAGYQPPAAASAKRAAEPKPEPQITPEMRASAAKKAKEAVRMMKRGVVA